jgi:LytS/YehU family sensor histidine kinase
VAPDTVGVQVPRLLLQPLLEDAIEHGALRRADGSVAMRAKRTSAGSRSPFTTTAPGISEPARQHSGLGLRLTRDRLKLAYPTASMTIDSSGAGTSVTIVLPSPETRP